MRFLNWLLALACVVALAACGGGGGGAGTTPFPAPGASAPSGETTATVSIAISSTNVTSTAPVTVSATVKDATGAAVSGQVVTFASTANLGILSPGSGLTDANGVATVQLAPTATTTSGADTVVASTTINTVVFTASVGFTVTPTSGPVGTPSMSLLLSTTTVTTTTPATVTASVKDANGGAVVGQVVNFATPGALGRLTPASALTDANGNAVVQLSPASITTIGADQVVASATVNGTLLTPASTGFQVAITNADLILTLSAPQIPNTGSQSVSITATAIDSNRNTVAGVPVTIKADAGAVLTGASGVTGSNGTVVASLGIGSDASNRLITVTATSGAITRIVSVQVIGTNVTSTLIPAVVAPGAAGQIQYRVLDQAGNPMVNQAVQIVASGLTPSTGSGVTGANGDFNFNYVAPTSANSYPVTANIAGKPDAQTVVVQSTGTVPPVIANITSASVSANPSVVSTNLAGSQSNRSEIRALFLGSNNLPVQNVRARFDLAGDVNSVGGSFTTDSANPATPTTLYSDVNGVVSTAYAPASRSSPTDGVKVRVCYGISDADPNFLSCANSKVVTLTVTSEPLGVSIGTNELILGDNPLTYKKQFVVSVSDSAGVAKADVNLAVSLDLPYYRKGEYLKKSTWIKSGEVPGVTPIEYGLDQAICNNEDKNRNGVLENGEDNDAVNGNNDGILWPRKPDVIVSLLQPKTGSDGTAVLQIEYARDHASWVDALITVSASGVSGSEGRATYLVSPVPVAADAITSIDSSPAFQYSPYGRENRCTNRN